MYEIVQVIPMYYTIQVDSISFEIIIPNQYELDKDIGEIEDNLHKIKDSKAIYGAQRGLLLLNVQATNTIHYFEQFKLKINEIMGSHI